MDQIGKSETIDQILICDFFSNLVSSGIPILDEMDIIGKRFPAYQKHFAKIKEGLYEGQNIAITMSELGVFHPLIVSFVDGGEKTGAMDLALKSASRLMERGLELEEKGIEPRKRDEILFYYATAEMVRYEKPDTAFRTLARYISYPPKEVLADMGGRVKRGAYVSTAMKKNADFFPEFAVKMLENWESLEQSILGYNRERMNKSDKRKKIDKYHQIDVPLKKIAQYLEKEYTLKR